MEADKMTLDPKDDKNATLLETDEVWNPENIIQELEALTEESYKEMDDVQQKTYEASFTTFIGA